MPPGKRAEHGRGLRPAAGSDPALGTPELVLMTGVPVGDGATMDLLSSRSGWTSPASGSASRSTGSETGAARRARADLLRLEGLPFPSRAGPEVLLSFSSQGSRAGSL